MYDTLEDTDAPENNAPAQTGRKRLWVGAAIVAGLAILIAVGMFTVQSPRGTLIDVEAAQAEHAAYKAALTESDPALRRARLTDFLETYKTSSRRQAATAQLSILSTAEADDWAILTHILFDVDKTNAHKLFALERYSERWSGDMLGGRGAEITRMRDALSGDIVDLPDRDMPIIPDDIPDADNMVGGSLPPQRVITRPSDTAETRPFPAADITIPPKLNRNAKPRYPRRALDRDVEALIVLRLFVDERGRVRETELVSSEAERYEKDFIRAAERAARRTRYHPMTVNGVPAPASEGLIKRFRFEIAD